MYKIFFSVILLALSACGEDKPYHLESTGNPPDLSEISRQTLQQTLAGTAYGNLFKIEKALAEKDTVEVEQLANETRYLLLAYVDNIEMSNLPDLEERAKNAIFDLARILFYLEKKDWEKAGRHTRLCKIHLDSLRQLTGLKRVN